MEYARLVKELAKDSLFTTHRTYLIMGPLTKVGAKWRLKEPKNKVSFD